MPTFSIWFRGAGVLRDTIHGLRGWRRTPGSALLVILALGLSGGALITLVSLFNALFWRELPVARPGELVGVSGRDGRVPESGSMGMPASLFASLDRAQHVFQTFAGFQRVTMTAVIRGSTERMAMDGVSGRYFDTLGVVRELGRLLNARDVDGASPVATNSYRSWRTRFGADRDVIGQTFRLQGELVTVIGVAPRAFTGLEVGVPADAWVPASLAPRLLNLPPGLGFFDALVGRLHPGVTLRHARAELESLWPPARDAAAAEVAASLVKAAGDDTRALQPDRKSVV